MAKTPSPQIVTANDLLSGEVIYMRADGEWTTHMLEAKILETDEEALSQLSRSQAQHQKAVGVYLSPVLQSPNGIKPTHFREDFRRTGPSNYTHGKQEQQHV